MTPTQLQLTLTLLLALSACAHETPAAEPAKPEPANPTFTEPEADAEKRINHYFQDAAATPAFKDCWSRVQGKGLISLAFNYKKAEANWAFDGVATEVSDLPKGQDATAQQCLQAALGGTSFPVNAANDREKATEAFAIHWTWPVPMPTTSEEMSARMAGNTGNGVNVPGCSECVSRIEYPYGLKCVPKKSGGNLDCREITSNGCSWSPTTCLRGSFGMAGGAVMF